MHSLRRVIIVKRVYEMKKMCCVFNNIFRFLFHFQLFIDQAFACHFSWLLKPHYM